MSIIKKFKKVIPYSVKRSLHSLLPVPPLINSLPLAMPWAIHIDPCNSCNFKCVFCPTGDQALLKSVKRKSSMMSMEVFEKIVADLTSMKEKYNRTLYQAHLYKDGEPFLNKNFFDMVRLIKSQSVANVVSTTTNGSLLDANCIDNLIASKLDLIRISIEHVNSEGYSKVTNTFSDYDKIISNVSNLYRVKESAKSKLYVTVKITDSGMSNEDLDKFHRDFRGIGDEIRVDTLMGWSFSEKKDFTLGKDVHTGMNGKSQLREHIICPEPFTKLAINSDGTVSVCCVDWSQGTVVGDVRTDTIDTIWNGKKMNNFRNFHISGGRQHIEPCAQCQYVKGISKNEDLDLFKERLQKIYCDT